MTAPLSDLDKLCKYYVKGGLCLYYYAPEGEQSRCIGVRDCNYFEKVKKWVFPPETPDASGEETDTDKVLPAEPVPQIDFDTQWLTDKL